MKISNYLSKKLLSTTLISCALSLGAASTAIASTPACEVDHTVNFGGMSWENNLIMVDIQRFILENGYGCKTAVLPTETIPALAALERGDLAVNSEIWLNSLGDLWDDAVERGNVIRSGDLYVGVEAWFIPRYVQERFPDLKKATDLPKYKEEFKDPENPNKGRFYTSPAGWSSEVINANLFEALDLNKDFTLYQPGNPAAKKAAVQSEYRRKKNIAFYYWAPTPLVSGMDLVRLELPEYDEEKYKCLLDANCENPQATAYPHSQVFIALNKQFAEDAPKLKAFFDNNTMTEEVMSSILAHLEETGDGIMDVAKWFLVERPDVWTQWVPEDVAERVKKAL